MLAATSVTAKTDSLELFRVALSMYKNNEENIPDSLKDYLNILVSQAKDIVDDPSSLSNVTYPEAIELAVDLTTIEGFSREINSVQDFRELNSETASRILEVMEVSSAY